MNSQPVLSEAEIEAQRKDMLVPIRAHDDAKTAAWATEENRQINTLCDMAIAYRASLDSGAVERTRPTVWLAQSMVGIWHETSPDNPDAVMAILSTIIPPSTAKESLTVGGEEDENRIIERRKKERRGFYDAYLHVMRHQDCRKKLLIPAERKAHRRHPSAEPINAGPGRSESLRSQSKDSSAQAPVAESSLAPAPASGQAEAMREAAAKVCERIAAEHIEAARIELAKGNARLGYPQITAERCAIAIRSLPLPPESEAEGLLKWAEKNAFDGTDGEWVGRCIGIADLRAHLSAKPAASEPSGAEELVQWALNSVEKMNSCEADPDDVGRFMTAARAYLGAGR